MKDGTLLTMELMFINLQTQFKMCKTYTATLLMDNTAIMILEFIAI